MSRTRHYYATHDCAADGVTACGRWLRFPEAAPVAVEITGPEPAGSALDVNCGNCTRTDLWEEARQLANWADAREDGA